MFFFKFQQYQVRGNKSNTAEPAVAEEKVTEHGAIEENTVAAIKVEEFVSVKQITTVKQSMKYINQTCRNRKWHWKAQPGSKKL
jgi:hypothetical protein